MGQATKNLITFKDYKVPGTKGAQQLWTEVASAGALSSGDIKVLFNIKKVISRLGSVFL